MLRILILALCIFFSQAKADTLTPINIIAGSSSGQIFGWPACDGNAYKLTSYVAPQNMNIVKAYLFVASAAPAIDAWLLTSDNQIIAEVHHWVSYKPNSVPPLYYWESERSYGKDSILITAGTTIWFMALCYDPTNHGTTIEPYAEIYTRAAP